MKKIWIDLDNTPHIPFFKPIIEELKDRDLSVVITARDAYQVCALADYHKISYIPIGRHYGKKKIFKILGSIIRTLQMIPTIFYEKPELAVSHGSRTQLMVASLLRIPSIMIYDYEFVQALTCIQPTLVMVPDIIPNDAVKMNKSRICKYPGIKEDVYVAGFNPDPAIKRDLGISDDSLVITIRPPATEAHYHSHKSEELFEAIIAYLVQKPNVKLILLPRNERQEAFIRNMWSSLIVNNKLVILDHAVDGLNLIWFSDLVISGGGTMNREAAALGVPVYSIFRGKIGAVDKSLSDAGRLVLLEKEEDFPTKINLTRRDKNRKVGNNNNSSLQHIVGKIIEVAGV